MIDINNLHFSYGKKKLFADLQLKIIPGRIHGLLGLNGAGKTTLMKLICGLNFPTGGDIRVRDYSPRERSVHFLSHTYMLFEEPYIPNISSRELQHVFSNFYPGFEKEYFEHCLSKFQLPQEFIIGKLSFGQKKKLLLSFALSCGVAILLLDEPTNGLDIPSKVVFRELIADKINPNQAVILSTHQVREVESLMGSVIILNDGKIILNSNVEAIKTSFRITQHEEEMPGNSPNLIHTEKTAGRFRSVWQVDSSASDTAGSLMDFELLFNAAVTNPGKFLRFAERESG